MMTKLAGAALRNSIVALVVLVIGALIVLYPSAAATIVLTALGTILDLGTGIATYIASLVPTA